MRISELTAKLEALDTARGESLAELKTVRSNIKSDLSGVVAVLDGYVDRGVVMTDANLERLDSLFMQSGLLFRPREYMAATTAGRAALDASTQSLLKDYPQAQNVSDVRDLAATLRREVEDLERERARTTEIEARMQVYLQSVDAYNKANPETPITPDNAAALEAEAGYLDWLLNRPRRAAYTALREAGGAATFKQSTDKLKEAKAEQKRTNALLMEKSGQRRNVDDALERHHHTALNVTGAEKAAETVADHIKKGFDNDAFVDGFAKVVPDADRDGFLEAAVKARGLQRVLDFLDGKIGDISRERDGMSSTLSKLRKAKRNGHGSKTAKGVNVTSEQLDQAAAATRLHGRYAARNASAVHSSTMHYAPAVQTSSSSDFLLWYLVYQQFLFSSTAADAAAVKDISGLTPDHAASVGLSAQQFADLKPDFGAVVTDLAQSVDGQAALASLGVDTASLNVADSVGQIDTSGLAANFSDVASNISVTVPSVDVGSFTAPTVSVSDYGGGGGFSGGFDGGSVSAPQMN